MVKKMQYFKPIILADGLLLPATLSQSWIKVKTPGNCIALHIDLE